MSKFMVCSGNQPDNNLEYQEWRRSIAIKCSAIVSEKTIIHDTNLNCLEEAACRCEK